MKLALRLDVTSPKFWSIITSLLVILAGLLVLCGWFFDITLFKSVLPNLPTMKANTALGLIFIGVALACLQDGLQRSTWQKIGIVCSVLAAIIGLITLAEHAFAWNARIDEWLVRDDASLALGLSPGRMAEASATSLALLGIALWLLYRQWLHLLAQLLALLVIALGLLVLAGYIYGVDTLREASFVNAVSLYSAFAFLIAATGILLTHPSEGLMKTLTAKAAGGVIARGLLPAALLVPLGLGWLRLYGEALGLYDTRYGLALFAVSNIFIFVLLVWWSAWLLNRSDLGRNHAEAKIESFAHRLEVIHEIDTGILTARSVAEVAEATLRHIHKLIPCQQSGIGLPDADASIWDVYLAIVNADTAGTQHLTLPLNPAWPQIFAESTVVRIDDLREHRHLNPLQGLFLDDGMISSLHIALNIQGKFGGSFNLLANAPNFFTDEYQEIATQIAHELEIAIGHLQFAEELEDRSRHLAQIVEERTVELERAKVRVEAILDNSTDGILWIDRQSKIEHANSAFGALFACESQGYSGQPLTSLVQPQDREKLLALIYAVSEDQISRSEEFQATGQGRAAFAAQFGISAVAAADEALLGYVCTVHDISYLKERERLLRASEERFRSLLDAAPVATVITDRDGRITLFNIQAEVIFGYTRTEVIGQKVETLVPSLLREAHVFHRASYMDAPRVREMGSGLELFAERKDSSTFPVEIQLGYIETESGVQAMAFVVDITERKEQERELRYHASLQESVTDAVITTDLNFQIKTWNRAAERIYGWRRDEVLDNETHVLLRTEFANDESQDEIRQQFLTKGYWTGEVTQYHKDGHAVDLLSSVMLVHDDYGHATMIVAVNHDITDRKNAEYALQAKAEEEREFQNYLRQLQEITIELTQVDQLSDFYRRAVELGLSRLGFERLGFLLYEAESGMAVGAFGTDAVGNVVDERNLRLAPTGLTGILARAISQKARFAYDNDAALFSNGEQIATGWNAAAVLWNGKQSLGWLAADNAVHHLPASKAQLDILSLYALTLASLLARKQVEAALRQSEANLRAMLNSTSVAIALVDTDGTIRLANQLAHEMCWILYGQGIQTGKTSVYDLDIAASEESRLALKRVFIGEQVAGEYARTVGTREFVVDLRYDPVMTIKGVVIGAVLSLIDISLQKKVEIQLRDQRNFLQSVINNLPDLIMVKDMKGYFRLVNNTAAHIYGITPEEMVGMTDADLNPHQAEVRFFMQKDQEALAAGTPVFIPEETLLDRTYQTTKVPLLNAHGDYDRLLVVASDITLRKRAEETLRMAFEKEKEVSELKSRFVSMASHEFRTPLATILAMTETLSTYRDSLAPEQVERRLTNIRGQVAHLKAIIEDVLQLARIQVGRVGYQPTRIDLDVLFRIIIDEVLSQYNRTHRVEYQCDPSLPKLMLDQKLIRQIITNLLSNAMKYSAAGATIDVSVAVIDKHVSLRIRDAGIGIPEADLKHLFEPFHRATNVGTISGTGLGLAIAKESVELHGGSIVVKSQVGVGTSFTVEIPVAVTGEDKQ